MKSRILYVFGLFFVLAIVYSFTTIESSTANDPWEISAKYQKMTNAVHQYTKPNT